MTFHHTRPPILLDKVGYSHTISGKGANGRILIVSHKAAVTLDIRTENGSELSFKVFGGHGFISSDGPNTTISQDFKTKKPHSGVFVQSNGVFKTNNFFWSVPPPIMTTSCLGVNRLRG